MYQISDSGWLDIQSVFNIRIRDVNRVPGPRDPKKLPDPGFQTTRKLPPRPLSHSETTGLPAQQGKSRHCSVLSETVATVSLWRSHLVHPYRRAHTTLGRHHVTDHVLGRVDYSGWWLVPGYVCEMLQYGICRRYYVTVERRLRPGVVSHMHWSPAQTAFTNTHRSTRRPPLDKQRSSAIITSTTVICRVTHNSRVWQLAVQCPLMFSQPADDHTHRRPPRHSAQWVVFSATGEGSNLNVVARCLLYFTKSILATCRRRETRTLA